MRPPVGQRLSSQKIIFPLLFQGGSGDPPDAVGDPPTALFALRLESADFL
jgi:hypothetical protein